MTDHSQLPATTGLDRRAVLGLAAAGAATMAMTSEASAEHDHSKMGHGAKNQALIDAALACVNRGEVCLEHCMRLIADGDTSIKDCMRTVSAMLPMCTALAKMAALDARRLKDFVKVCRDVCADCEDECKKHADKHAQCKACQDSCAACIKECKALIDA